MTTNTFFFDRDGIVNTRIMGGYVTDVDDFVFMPDFFALFRAVKERGFLAVLVTNQQGIGKGLMTEEDVSAIHEKMQRELRANTGFVFDDVYVAGEIDVSNYKECCGELCLPDNYVRRKPSPAMLLEAQERWNIDLSRSWMIGDSISDAEAGRAAGVKTILIGDYGSGTMPAADYIFPTLRAATETIVQML